MVAGWTAECTPGLCLRFILVPNIYTASLTGTLISFPTESAQTSNICSADVFVQFGLVKLRYQFVTSHVQLSVMVVVDIDEHVKTGQKECLGLS